MQEENNNILDIHSSIELRSDWNTIIKSIKESVLSADYINWDAFNEDEIKEIISLLIENSYVLNIDSSMILKSNYEIVVNSIKLDASSADYINWEAFREDEIKKIIELLIKFDYQLNIVSRDFLKNNKEIALNSIKKDLNSVVYISENLKNDNDIFKYLLLNKYFDNNNETLENKKINSFLDNEVTEYMLKDYYNDKDYEWIKNLNNILHIFLNSKPTIKMFENIFQASSEEEWKKHKRSNNAMYENIFGKICATLRNNNNYREALNKMYYLKNMKEILKDKYDNLDEAMKKYYEIYHSKEENKLEIIEPYKNVISELSALYVAKSKESYKKKILNELYNFIKPYFKIEVTNPLINKKLMNAKKKQTFKELYQQDDKEIRQFINKLIDCYGEVIPRSLAYDMIRNFIFLGKSKIKHIVKEPLFYDEYLRYKKALKLVKRLNIGYLTYNSPEVINYHDIISYNEIDHNYYYSGTLFNKLSLEQYEDYQKKALIFNQIKHDIVNKVRTIEVNDYIDDSSIQKLNNTLRFNDKYFVFNDEFVLNSFKWKDLNNAFLKYTSGINDNLIRNDLYIDICNYLINNGLIWLLLFTNKDYNQVLSDNNVNIISIIKLIDNMEMIKNFANYSYFDINNYKNLHSLNYICNYTKPEDIAILDVNIIEKLLRFSGYTRKDLQYIVEVAKELVCGMAKRTKSTVPFINGEKLNYKYSLYDFHDETILLSGIKTDSCFKIDGHDHDFLHYCALDKNGFVMKITDFSGRLIARASGFRNGNCVFINQLRTIYDEGGVKFLVGKYDNEKDDIVSVFKKACEDIINISQNNKDEKDKIEYVFVTKSYALSNYPDTVPEEAVKKIGSFPMDNQSSDWKCFLESTSNLQELHGFTTDYGEYPLICIASSKRGYIESEDIKKGDVRALYERKRNKIICSGNNIEIYKRVNKIEAIKCFYEKKEYIAVETPPKSTVFLGDNWYIICHNNEIIKEACLSFDTKALIEFNITKDIINNHIDLSQINETTINNQMRLLSKTSGGDY